MKFLIPSYKRSNRQKTLEYLHDLGYSRDQIIIATQTSDDYHAYSKRYASDALIIYSEAHNVSGNRNNLLRTLNVGESAIMLDDDISHIDRLVCIKDSKHPFGRFAPITQKDALDRLIASAFDYCRQHGGVTFGAYSIHNERMMYGAVQNNGRWSSNKLFTGTIMGIIFTGQLFDERYDTKEDYAFLLRQICRGKPVFRMNNISPAASHFTKGGCQDAWESDKNLYSAMLLVNEFPDYVKPNPKKRSEVLQIRK